jgi:TPR repeat protein
MSGGVFICYRREETAFAARAIHDRIVQRLERESVFLDVDNIDLGVDWFNVLTERVGACDALVAVIGRNWVSSADKDGLRRIDDPDDFVRIEIEAALHRNVRVIPVLVDGAAMPKASELPESLKGLARRQGTEVSPARFEADVEKLTIALGSILDERRRRDAAEAAEKVAETRRPVTAEAERESKKDDGSRLFSGTRATGALSAPRSPPVRTYRSTIAVAIAIGIAAALVILVATFGSPTWKFSPPAGDKAEAEQAAADKAAANRAPADKAAADKAAANKAAADKAAADKAAADKAAADKAAADKAAADKAAADKAAADKAAAEKAAADKAAADKAAAEKAAAEKAAAEEQYQRGNSYFYGQGGNHDYQQAQVWYRKAADQGDENAQYMLGRLYEGGLGVIQDYGQAKAWYQKAADQGHIGAKADLQRLAASNAPTASDKAAADKAAADKAAADKAAADKAAAQQLDMGDRYFYGRGVDKDYGQAFAWYQKAADHGNAPAQYKLAQMYDYGLGGMPIDKQTAFGLYVQAAQQGLPQAELAVGYAYANGSGVSKDKQQARLWYTKAAAQGNPTALENLRFLDP